VKYAALIRANLLRRKTRFVLTVGSFAVALFLFGVLMVIRASFNQGIEVAGADRLIVINRVAIIQPLPLSYYARISRIPGVRVAAWANWFGGIYQDERNFFPQLAIDVAHQRQTYPEFLIDDAEWNAFVKDREGAFAGAQLAKRFGWKIGDRIPLRSTIYPGQWEFNLRGIYRGSRPQDDETQFWFQWDRLEEQLSQGRKGYVGWYVVRVADPADAVRIVKTIDSDFANSPWETTTETESAFAAGWIKQMGNIQFIILSIGSVVFLTLLLVTGNTMAIAVRERTPEWALLKAIGYPDAFVLGLVLAESLTIALLGGGLGLLLAKLFTLSGDPTRGLLPTFYLSGRAAVLGMALALAVGVASGILPALGAMRLRVVDALRRI
jgi:putative ABC transport system permease protein